MEYRLLDKKEINQVILLVDKVAKKHIFNDYDQEGIDSFNQVNQESFYLDRHNLTYVALENDQVVAMATLSNNNHLSLLFVLDSYQHLGIGTKLLEIIDNLVLGDLSVNSGIEAKDFYLKAGFELTDNLIKKDGILYYPMVKKREVKQQFENYDQVIEFYCRTVTCDDCTSKAVYNRLHHDIPDTYETLLEYGWNSEVYEFEEYLPVKDFCSCYALCKRSYPSV